MAAHRALDLLAHKTGIAVRIAQKQITKIQGRSAFSDTFAAFDAAIVAAKGYADQGGTEDGSWRSPDDPPCA